MADIEVPKKSEVMPLRQRQLNFYEILEVPTDASRLQIREAYIRLKAAYSANSQVLYSLVSEEDARKTLELLDEAYRVLDDDLLRRDYDEKVLGKVASTRPDEQIDQRREPATDQNNGVSMDEKFTERRHNSAVLENQPSSMIEDLWAGERSEPKEGSHLSLAGQSAREKRFSLNAFDDSVKSEVHDFIAQASQVDGSFFRELRNLMNTTQEDIQDKTKISLQYIKAIEDDDFKTLPSVVYVKGFLKCYLQYLGLEREAPRLINSYTELYQDWQAKKGI
jgi:curved DNA-binding protein CbpA